MRRRMLLMVLATVFLLAMALNWWASKTTSYVPEESELPHSADLDVSFLACTNGIATIQVRNRGSQTVILNGYVMLYARDTNRTAGFRWVDSHDFTNRFSAPLGRGSSVTVNFPAPTNGVPWRATVGAVGQRQISIKQTLRRAPFLKRYPFVLRPGYAHTDWITP